MSIRLKVILPYLLLTVVVSVIGVYVVTSLVSNRMEERLTNQLLEAGRVVSDSFVKQELQHVKNARVVAFTSGLADALNSENRAEALALVEPIFVGLGVENLILITPQGNELVHLLLNERDILEQADQNTGVANSLLVTPFLTDRDPKASPIRALGVNMINDETYYYTSIPVALNGEFSGVIVVGTSIRKTLPALKSTALADIVIYGGNGRAIGTTLSEADQSTLQSISITQGEYEQIIASENIVTGKNISLDKRPYSIAHGPLQIGNDRVGVFAVALPMDFVIKSGASGRTTYMILFTGVFFSVLIIGFLVSRMIINPLYSLVNTSQAITAGDLEQRTGIRSNDEMGLLANTFDRMTSNLQERTRELERTNEMLKNIDRTKTNFIQISAHELRTPLTLIMGYSQMLEQDTKNDPQLLSLAQGILDGSERMTSIVESMLDVSRIDSNTLSLKKTVVPIEMLIKKVNKGFAKAFEERNIVVNIGDLHELPPVPADPDLLLKAFNHIIMNAIKFTPDGGSITISGRCLNGNEQPEVEIAIRDTGIGIDPALHQLIFEKFGQAGDVLMHSSGKTKFKGGGPGLGLAIARGIVEAHGGRIWVESPGYDEHLNPGSTFFVSLPAEKHVEIAV